MITIDQLHNSGAIDRETMAALAQPGSVMDIPPITAGRLALLDLVESPLLTGKPMTSRDLWIAVWILSTGKDAVSAINKAVRENEALASAFALAATTPDHLREYLAALRVSSQSWDAVDAAISRFAEQYGSMPGDMAERLQQAITAAMAGFGTIADSTSEPTPHKKKRIRSTLNGWLRWVLLWLLNSRPSDGRNGSGIFRWPPPVTSLHHTQQAMAPQSAAH